MSHLLTLEISILNLFPPGQGPVQPAVGDPASAGGLDQMIHRGPFQPLPFCDYVIQ